MTLPPLLPLDRQPDDPRDCALCPASERRNQPVDLVEVGHPDGWRYTEIPLCRDCERRADLPGVVEERRVKAGGEPTPLPRRRVGCRVCSAPSCDCDRPRVMEPGTRRFEDSFGRRAA